MEKLPQDDFGHLFRLHHKSLCDLAYNIVVDKDAAKDIVQEVFIKLWGNREKLTFGDQIKHYLFKATAHTAYNYVRSHKRVSPLEDYSGLSTLQTFPGTERVEYKELEIRARQAIDKLPPKCKAIYILSRHEGLKYQEIANTLGLSIKTVENQMGIALEKLRNELKPFLSPEFLALLAAIGMGLYALFC
jgi:RNA polymerase sigma-70 factor (ECF subfamily)